MRGPVEPRDSGPGQAGLKTIDALQQAAAILDEQAWSITARWVDRLEATLYAGRTDLGLEDIRDHAPVLVQGVAEALRSGQIAAAGAPWATAARDHALLRRAYPSEEKKQLSFPPFEIDVQRGEVRKDGSRVDLTPKEFELTVALFRNIGRLLSRGHLQETVWGRTGDLATRTVDTHVSQVRKKLDLRPESGYRVVPIYNYGYRLEKITPP